MKNTSPDKVRLERGGVILNASPTIDDVVDVMQSAFDENGMMGPPELALECLSSSTAPQTTPQTTKSELRIMLAFHRTLIPRWLIHYGIPKTVGPAFLLSSGSVSKEQFERRTSCGVISLYRHDCLIDDPVLLRKAIVWFLEHHSACPELSWILYGEAVRDADNTME